MLGVREERVRHFAPVFLLDERESGQLPFGMMTRFGSAILLKVFNATEWDT